MQLTQFWKLVHESGLNASSMTEHPDDWDRVLIETNYAPVSYTLDMVLYQLSYVNHQITKTIDLSMVIYHENRPVAVWPLHLLRLKSSLELRSNEGHVLPPLFISGLGERIFKVLMARIFELIWKLCKEFNIQTYHGAESFCGHYGASPWHCQLMQYGAQVKISHELYVDLSQGISEIKANFRKSYKSLLNSGLKVWSIDKLYREKGSVFNEFRELHKQVAGRVTRHDDTWERQELAIHKGAAFLIFLRSTTGRMVGGGLFSISPSEGNYAVGAYDRTLFENPLGHLVQMRAIEEMKSLGLKWYKIGERPYPGDSPAPTQKELNIAYFKEGFATHVFLRRHTELKVSFPR
jgi:FemAB family protein